MFSLVSLWFVRFVSAVCFGEILFCLVIFCFVLFACVVAYWRKKNCWFCYTRFGLISFVRDYEESLTHTSINKRVCASFFIFECLEHNHPLKSYFCFNRIYLWCSPLILLTRLQYMYAVLLYLQITHIYNYSCYLKINFHETDILMMSIIKIGSNATHSFWQ